MTPEEKREMKEAFLALSGEPPTLLNDDDVPSQILYTGSGFDSRHPSQWEVSNESQNWANPNHDPVNHPEHYTTHPSGIECIEITRHMNFNLGNAMKYIWRAGLKSGSSDIVDLEKAIWYIQDEIERRNNDA